MVADFTNWFIHTSSETANSAVESWVVKFRVSINSVDESSAKNLLKVPRQKPPLRGSTLLYSLCYQEIQLRAIGYCAPKDVKFQAKVERFCCVFPLDKNLAFQDCYRSLLSHNSNYLCYLTLQIIVLTRWKIIDFQVRRASLPLKSWHEVSTTSLSQPQHIMSRGQFSGSSSDPSNDSMLILVTSSQGAQVE